MSETCCATECPTCGHVEGELLEVRPEVFEWRYSVVQISADMIDEDGGRLENYLCGEGSVGLELTCIIPSPTGFLAIFKRRRRTEPDQGKCCECGGQESEGEQ